MKNFNLMIYLVREEWKGLNGNDKKVKEISSKNECFNCFAIKESLGMTFTLNH